MKYGVIVNNVECYTLLTILVTQSYTLGALCEALLALDSLSKSLRAMIDGTYRFEAQLT